MPSKPAGRVLFDCPVCRIHHDGPVGIGLESNVEEHSDLVEMWPGGPMVEDPGPSARHPVLVDQTFRTTACGDVFSVGPFGMYEVHWITYGEPPEVSRLIVCEKGLGSDDHADPRALPGVW
jgi:hypothetical protein